MQAGSSRRTFLYTRCVVMSGASERSSDLKEWHFPHRVQIIHKSLYHFSPPWLKFLPVPRDNLSEYTVQLWSPAEEKHWSKIDSNMFWIRGLDWLWYAQHLSFYEKLGNKMVFIKICSHRTNQSAFLTHITAHLVSPCKSRGFCKLVCERNSQF